MSQVLLSAQKIKLESRVGLSSGYHRREEGCSRVLIEAAILGDI